MEESNTKGEVSTHDPVLGITRSKSTDDITELYTNPVKMKESNSD